MRLLLVWAIAPLLAAASPAASPGALETLVRREAAAGFSGAILVKQGDKVLIDRSVGSIGGVRVRPNSRFWISSTGKQFVSAAIFKLRDDGRISLDDRLDRWLPDVPADKRTITIRQLLSHTSGLPQGYAGEEARDNESAVRSILAIGLAARPGERFIYSNENFYLAAAIVERIAQQSYRRFAEANFFAPLGMTQSGLVHGPAGVLPTKAPTPARLKKAHWGISGHYSSARDLARWFRALEAGTILKPGSVAEMWRPVAKIGEGEAASGWFVSTTPRGTKRIWTRGNDDFGANSLIYGYPDRDIVIVILTHSGDKPDGPSWSRAVVGELEEALAL